MYFFDLIKNKHTGIPTLKMTRMTPEPIEGTIIRTAQDIFDLTLSFGLGEKCEEYVYLFSLNTRGKVLGVFEVAHGDHKSCYYSTPQIATRVLLTGGHSAILAHNHPSGDVTPSEPDKGYTTELAKSLDSLGIELLDHVVIGENCYFSMKDEGIL